MNIPDETIQELLIWIDANLHLRLKIEDVANRAGYSKWHLQRMFRERTGKTLANYIRKRRLLRAAQDLAHTPDTIMVIALRYGYDNQQIFTRIFKRHFDMPPGRWRNLHDLFYEMPPTQPTRHSAGAAFKPLQSAQTRI